MVNAIYKLLNNMLRSICLLMTKQKKTIYLCRIKLKNCFVINRIANHNLHFPYNLLFFSQSKKINIGSTKWNRSTSFSPSKIHKEKRCCLHHNYHNNSKHSSLGHYFSLLPLYVDLKKKCA